MTVVSIRGTSAHDVYIGRPRKAHITYEHYGNPFSHLPLSQGFVHVDTREEAVRRYETWLAGTTDTDLRQQQRRWILEHLHELRGKVLGCWCAPLACHGDVLERLANG